MKACAPSDPSMLTGRAPLDAKATRSLTPCDARGAETSSPSIAPYATDPVVGGSGKSAMTCTTPPLRLSTSSASIVARPLETGDSEGLDWHTRLSTGLPAFTAHYDVVAILPDNDMYGTAHSCSTETWRVSSACDVFHGAFLVLGRVALSRLPMLVGSLPSCTAVLYVSRSSCTIPLLKRLPVARLCLSYVPMRIARFSCAV